MKLSLLFAFLATNFLLNIAPGPAVLQMGRIARRPNITA